MAGNGQTVHHTDDVVKALGVSPEGALKLEMTKIVGDLWIESLKIIMTEAREARAERREDAREARADARHSERHSDEEMAMRRDETACDLEERRFALEVRRHDLLERRCSS